MSERPTPPAPVDAQDGPPAPDAVLAPPGDQTADRELAEQAEHGRIGYGRHERWTAIGLAVVLILTLLAIGVASQWGDANGTENEGDGRLGQLTGQPAPDFTLTLLNGGTFRLSEQRGKVVVVNFWASWCAPCKQEMPALDRVAAARSGEVVFVGVGLKNDRDADVAAFLRDYPVRYAIGRDLGAGGNATQGPIEATYGVYGYPTTIVIAPDGTVDAVVFGPQSEAQLHALIDAAKD